MSIPTINATDTQRLEAIIKEGKPFFIKSGGYKMKVIDYELEAAEQELNGLLAEAANCSETVTTNELWKSIDEVFYGKARD